MRKSFRGFLSDLERLDREGRDQWENRIAQFALPTRTVLSADDLIEVLFAATEFLVEGRVTFSDRLAVGSGSGSSAIRERFEELFQEDMLETVEAVKHGTGTGLRGVVRRYLEHCLEDLSREGLYPFVDGFFEVEYGPRLARDYALMHSDGRDYFRFFAGLLPRSIREQETEYVMGSAIVDERPVPRMREVYVRHPLWISQKKMGMLK